EADELRAGMAVAAEPAIPRRALADDGRHGRERLDVIDRGRKILEPVCDREGRLVAREWMFAFETVEQRTFFAANVSTRAAPQMDFEIELAAKNVPTEQRCLFGLGNRALQ